MRGEGHQRRQEGRPIRPPFADFSSIAVREMMKWLPEHALWANRMQQVWQAHVEPVSTESGLDFEQIVEELGEFFGQAMGAVFEDLCSRRYEELPENIVDDFLKQRGFRLPPLAKVYLQALRDSAPGIYEVVAVRPGHGVTVRDTVVEGEPIDVTEVAGSRSLAQWDVIVARIIRHGEERVFTGVVTPLQSEDAKTLKEDVRGRLHELAERGGPALTGEQFRAAAHDTLREVAPAIGAVRIREVVASRRKPFPELRNSDGDPIEFIQVSYLFEKTDRKEIVARLDSQTLLERAGKRPPAWVWLSRTSLEPRTRPSAADRPGEGGEQFGDDSAVSLAHVSLSAKRLTLTVNSRARLEKARALIESVLAPLIGAGEVDVHSIEEMMDDADDDEPPSDRELSHEAAQKMRHKYLDRHYRKVLEEPVPMLGGRTPRDAARDAPGRELLVELLKHYENAQARAGFSYDFGWMWRELGIDHLRK
jgi:hypothetical protein